MAKIITTMIADGIDFEYICSFKTENFIGVWCYNHERFVLMKKDSDYFDIYILPLCKDLKQLDDEVYNVCEEHIEEAFDKYTYEFVLED